MFTEKIRKSVIILKCENTLNSPPLPLPFPPSLQMHFADNPHVYILPLKIQRNLTGLPQKDVHPSVSS